MSEEISREEIAALLARGSEEMTREQACNTLQNAAWLGTNEDRERIEGAVELLCGESCGDCISRQEVKELYYKDGYIDFHKICELPSVQHEPSGITDEQAIRHLQSTGWMQNHDREMYESGLREKLADDSGSYDSLILCEDAISRQESIASLKKHFSDDDSIDTECGAYWHHGHVIDVLQGMPSVTPKQRVGHWTYLFNSKVNGLKVCECDACKKRAYGSTHFCPNCGARMVEPQDKDIIWYDTHNYSEIVLEPQEGEDK